jgi:hypothetical protein
LSHGHHPSNILTFTVESLTFKSLIEKHNLENKQIKYVFMDTEGHDCDIILSTDFSNLDIQNICFEILHADGPFSKGKKLENTIKHLNSFNFQQNLNKNIDYSMWMTRIN